MEEGHEVTNEDERKAERVEAYAAAKTRLQTLQDAARTEQKVLNGIVEYLKSGGDYRQVAERLHSYLTGTVPNLMQNMWVVCVEMEALQRELSGLGITIPIDYVRHWKKPPLNAEAGEGSHRGGVRGNNRASPPRKG
jgi:hypothetical protein